VSLGHGAAPEVARAQYKAIRRPNRRARPVDRIPFMRRAPPARMHRTVAADRSADRDPAPALVAPPAL